MGAVSGRVQLVGNPISHSTNFGFRRRFPTCLLRAIPASALFRCFLSLARGVLHCWGEGGVEFEDSSPGFEVCGSGREEWQATSFRGRAFLSIVSGLASPLLWSLAAGVGQWVACLANSPPPPIFPVLSMFPQPWGVFQLVA